MTDGHWPIVFAAMRKAAETESTDLAEAAAMLLDARAKYVSARSTYEGLFTFVGRRVGLLPAAADDAPPPTPRSGPANDRK